METEKTTLPEKAREFAELLENSTETPNAGYAYNMAQSLSAILWEAKMSYPTKREFKNLFDEQKLFTSTHSQNPEILLNNVKDSVKKLLGLIGE